MRFQQHLFTKISRLAVLSPPNERREPAGCP
jgi:hypothetical protein